MKTDEEILKHKDTDFKNWCDHEMEFIVKIATDLQNLPNGDVRKLKILVDFAEVAYLKARESEREKTRTETAKEIFEKLENAFETILGYDAKGEDVICWEKFVKIRDEILTNKKEAETKVKE